MPEKIIKIKINNFKNIILETPRDISHAYNNIDLCLNMFNKILKEDSLKTNNKKYGLIIYVDAKLNITPLGFYKIIIDKLNQYTRIINSKLLGTAVILNGDDFTKHIVNFFLKVYKPNRPLKIVKKYKKAFEFITSINSAPHDYPQLD